MGATIRAMALSPTPAARNSASRRAWVVRLPIAPYDVDACLIALADMLLVPEAHFAALLEAAAAPAHEALVATGNARRAQVPALFGRAHFAALCKLKGDRGAAALLPGAMRLDCAASLLADFDRPEDFEPDGRSHAACHETGPTSPRLSHGSE